MNLGLPALMSGELEQAKPLLEEELRIAQRIDNRLMQASLVGAVGCRSASGAPRMAAPLSSIWESTCLGMWLSRRLLRSRRALPSIATQPGIRTACKA